MIQSVSAIYTSIIYAYFPDCDILVGKKNDKDQINIIESSFDYPSTASGNIGVD